MFANFGHVLSAKIIFMMVGAVYIIKYNTIIIKHTLLFSHNNIYKTKTVHQSTYIKPTIEYYCIQYSSILLFAKKKQYA